MATMLLANELHADAAITDGEDDTQRYAMFDDLALGVMQRNCAVLEAAEGEKTPMETDRLEFRCDVVTPHSGRGEIGASSTIDLATVLAHVVEHQAQSTSLPSTLCCIDSIVVEDATNTLPVDIRVGCCQNNIPLGSYIQGTNLASTTETAGPSLFVLHSGAAIHPQGGRVVHTANNFVDGEHFKTYLHALDGDIEDSATVINGGNAVEYLSPTAQLTGNTVKNGDFLVNIMYKNPMAFKSYVQAIRTPVTDSAGDGEDQYKFSLRMHADDWTNLNRAVQANVIQPLRKNIIDLKLEPKLTFTLDPDVLPPVATASATIKPRANVDKWNATGLKDHPGRAAVSLKVVMRFV